MCTNVSAVFEFKWWLQLLRSLSLLSSFTIQRGREWKKKPKAFLLWRLWRKQTWLQTCFLFYGQEREIYHVGKSQVIFRNTGYKVQWAVKNATYLNALELCHWQFAYCPKWQANADSDSLSCSLQEIPRLYRYRCNFILDLKQKMRFAQWYLLPQPNQNSCSSWWSANWG